MKHLAFCFALLLCPLTVAANEIEIGDVPIETCNDITYLQQVDITIGEDCLRTQPSNAPVRTLFETDGATHPLMQSWASAYAMQAPTSPLLVRKKLAIIDTGFTADDAWLQSFITQTYDVITDSEHAHDTVTHGTAVATAAILAMHEAPVELLIIKIDHHGQLEMSSIIKGIDYAMEQGAHVINLSIGGTSRNAAEEHAIQAALAKNITVVAAAGNSGNGSNAINYPASYDGVLSIGAINQARQRAAFSNYNEHVTFVAPGEAVPLLYKNHLHATNGTSFASPFAAATIASIMQSSDASQSLLRSALIEQATDINAAGFDEETGYGIINSRATLAWLRGHDEPLHTLSTDTITITFSKPVAPTVQLSLYKDGQKIHTVQRIVTNMVYVTPSVIEEHAIYTLKIDRDVRSAHGETLQQPMYVPLVFALP